MSTTKTHLVAAFVLMLSPLISAADETEWLVAPYIWATYVTLD